MPFTLGLYRRALRQLSAWMLSIQAEDARWSRAQKHASFGAGIQLQLPHIPMKGLQILDPNDPNFGKLCFVAGIDAAGDPDRPICGL